MDRDLHAQPANNYGYDASGRLTRDSGAGLNAITWNAASRVATITRASDSIEFIYDGLGNRIAKITRPGTDPATWRHQYFVRDEKGAILATYKRDPASPASAPALDDQTIFGGSSRIGVWSAPAPRLILLGGPAVSSRIRGDKLYELSNYIGSVESTVTDRKTPVPGNGTVTHYQANTVDTTGYYPYGMLMPGRLTQGQPQAYRFGYSGLERDDDLKGGGNSYYTNARLFDPRIGRWLSPDPVLSAGVSPFIGFGNNPLRYSDPRGTLDVDSLKAQIHQDLSSKNWVTVRQQVDHAIIEEGKRRVAAMESSPQLRASDPLWLQAARASSELPLINPDNRLEATI